MDISNGVIYYTSGELAFLDGLNFNKIIKEKFDLPCAVVNDGKAAALAEIWKGNLKGVQNGAVIVLGTGIGGGIIIDGKLLQRNSFLAGELSFMLRSPHQASFNNILGVSGSAVGFIEESARILNLSDSKDGIDVFKAIEKQENEQITQLLQRYCREVAFIIMNLQAILDIEKVVIGGGISEQSILIKEIINQYEWMRSGDIEMNRIFPRIKIDACAFRNNANLLGVIYQLLIL